MLVLEHADEAGSHRFLTKTPLGLAVEHVEERICRRVAQLECHLRHSHRDCHAPRAGRWCPFQRLAAHRIRDIHTASVFRMPAFQRIGTGTNQPALGEFQANRFAGIAFGGEEHDTSGPVILSLGSRLFQPSVVTVSHLVVGPQCHPQTLAFPIDEGQQVPPLGIERLRITPARRSLDGTNRFHALGGQRFELPRHTLLGQPVALPPPQRHFAPTGMIGRDKRGS